MSYLYNAPVWLQFLIAFILLDYSNSIWHILLHRLPFMWRFHLVHHSDLDLDVTTSFRFHFGELIGSVFFRGATVFLTGASPFAVLIYEIAFDTSNQFQHCNMRIPFLLEKILNKVIVTSPMHGIHHSMIKRETDRNFAIIFSFWDRMHKTIRLNVPQNEIVTGVPVYPNAKELTIWNLFKLPITKIREWKESPAPENGNRNQLKK